MAGRSEANSARKPGGIGSFLVGGILTMLFWLTVSLILSIVIEWIGMLTVWKDADPLHAISMYEEEVSYANQALTSHSWFFTPGAALSDTLQTLDQSYMDGKAILSSNLSGDFWRYLPAFGENIENGILSAFYIVKIFLLRLTMLLLSLPIFLLAAWVAIVDGMVERQLRIAGGARESNVIFDFSSRYAFGIVVFTGVVYLSAPVAMNPLYAVLPGAIPFFLLTRSAVTMYKKYV